MGLAVEITGLKKSYAVEKSFWSRRSSFQALSDVNLQIRQGEIFGLVGRNGYGKTTLIRCVAGLLAPTEGTIRVYGHDTVHNAEEVRKLIGWVGAEERSFYLRLTGRQNLMFFARLQGVPDHISAVRVSELAQQLECEPLLDRRVHELSTGNRQRLSIIRGLLHRPRLLILDEPTRSLDPFAADDLRAVLARWIQQDVQRSILITSHLLFEIEAMSHRIAIMGKGCLGASGTLSQLRQRLGGGQRVEVVVQGNVPEAALTTLGALGVEKKVVEATPGPAEHRETVLCFQRQPHDDLLNRTLQKLDQLGLVMDRISTVELSLQDMIDRLSQKAEQSEPADDMTATGTGAAS